MKKTLLILIIAFCAQMTFAQKGFPPPPGGFPTISSFLPSTICTIVAQGITIEGSGLNQVTSVLFTGPSGVNLLGTITAQSDVSLTVTTPTNIDDGIIRLSFYEGSVDSASILTVIPTITPTFSQVAAVCSGVFLDALPITSTDGIIGSWSPSINNLSTTSYTFTPDAGQCSTTATQTIVVNVTPIPTVEAQTFCANATVASLVATGTDLKWYSDATGGTVLGSSDVLTSGMYYVTQTINGCESERTSVAVTINPELSYYADTDGDGYGIEPLITSCIASVPNSYSLLSGDCDDTNASINPDATEKINGIDDNCNGTIDEGTTPAPTEVIIGSQTWTTKNLDVASYSDGTIIPQVTDPTEWTNLTTGAWCYYNNDPANGAIYGKLYNWYAVAGIWDEASKTDVSQRKKLSTIGYHIPSNGEWTTLTDYLGGASVAGGKMKVTTLWNSPNQDATNSSGFEGLPGGSRYGNSTFGVIGNDGYWWSSSQEGTKTWSRYLAYFFGTAGDYYVDKTFGFSVRCIKDTTGSLTTNTVTDIKTNNAISGGGITLDGGAAIMARGVVWNAISSPTIDLTTKTTDGSGIGSFTSSITGLVANTTYYVRAYATNEVGTVYGAEEIFTTPAEVPIDTQAVPSYVPTNGLVGYWGFNGNANDISGNGNNGAVNGAILNVDRYDQINSAYKFIEQSNITAPNNSLLHLNSTDFTINTWIKIDSFPSIDINNQQYNQYYTILGKRQYGSCASNYSIGISSPSSPNGAGNLVFVQGPAGCGSFGYSNSPINMGIWYNISAVYTQNNQLLKLFVNNKLVLEQTGFTIPSTNSQNLWFGNDVSGYANYFPGTVDDTGIWNRALTQQELNSIYNSNNNCLLPTPTISASGSTTLCQGESVILTSSSPSGNIWSNGATTPSITVTDSGQYSVTFSNESCYTTSNPVVVKVNQLPTNLTLTESGPTSFCEGGSVTLSLNNLSTVRYLKFESYYSSDSGQVNVHEIQAFSNGVNVALNKPGYANSYEYGNWSTNGKNAVDGNSGSRWSSNRNDLGPDLTNPHFTVIDLQSQYNIQSVLLDLSSFQQTFSFKVSQDGSNWVEIGSGNSVSGSFTFNPPTTNFSDLLWSNGETTQSIIVSNSGSYSVKAFIGSTCSVTSNTVAVTVNSLTKTPIFTQVAPICARALLDALPTTSTNGITGIWSPDINNLATTDYTFTPAEGQCGTTATQTIIVNVTSTPTAEAQTFCASATVANLLATGTDLKWYANATDEIALVSSTAITTGTFYVTQTINGCESERVSVAVAVNQELSYYADADGDGYGIGSPITDCVASVPSGYSLLSGDCDDTNASIQLGYPYYLDQDGDGYGSSQIVYFCSSETPAGYSINNTDGDDTNAAIHFMNPLYFGSVQTYDVNAGDTSHAGSTYAWSITPAASTATITGDGSNSISIDWGTSPLGIYTIQVTETSSTGCVSSTVSMTTTIIEVPAVAPSAPANQSFCGSATVASLVATGTDLKWYPAPTGGTALTSDVALASGTYYVSQTINGYESEKTATEITINESIIPTFSQITSVCSGSAIAALPTTSTNGITGIWSPEVNNLVTTEYTFTPDEGQCVATETQTIEVISISAPTAEAQTFCTSATVENLIATGTDLKWYVTETDETALASDVALASDTYYVAQTLNGCESERTSVSVTINEPQITASASTVCSGKALTITAAAGTSTLPDNLQNGLVGYWPFNGNANDVSGNTNNGAVNGATLTSDRFGNANSAYSFDGNDFIEIADNPTLNFNSQFSVSFYIKNNETTGGWFWAMSKEIWGNSGLAIFIAENHLFYSKPEHAGWLVSTVLSNQSWDLITITNDNGLSKIYKNGGLIMSDIIPITNNSQSLVFGGSHGYSTSGSLKGILDDIAIYNRALSSSEITQLYSYQQTNFYWSTGETTATITPTPTETTTYWCDVTTNGRTCRKEMTISVSAPEVIPTFTPVAPICSGTVLDALPTTSTNGITGTWSPAVNNLATTEYTFTPDAGQCATTTTQTIVVTTTPVPTASANQTFCAGATVSNFTATGTALKWYPQATEGLTVSNATILTTGTYYVSQTLNGCESNKIAVAVNMGGEITEQPENDLICMSIGAQAKFSVVASYVNTTYQWETQSATDTGTKGWLAVSNSINYAGATTASLTITKSTATFPGTGRKYRVKVISNSCSVTSDVATLTDAALPGAVSGITASDLNICKYVGTENVLIYTATAGANQTFSWTVPPGVTLVPGQEDNGILTVNLSAVTQNSRASLGVISVKAVSDLGCVSSTAKTFVLTPLLPKTPLKLVLTSEDEGLNSLTAITRVGPYVGTQKEFILTTTEDLTRGSTSSSFKWILPKGVYLTSPTFISNTLDEMGNTRIVFTQENTISIDFRDVTPGVGALAISVYASGGCGLSYAKTLSLTKALPSRPATLVLSNGEIAPTAITRVGSYMGTPSEFTLTATLIITQGFEATKFKWTLPFGVHATSTHVFDVTVVNGVTTLFSEESEITIDFSEVPMGTGTLPVSVAAVNGTGTSIVRTLALTRALPTVPSNLKLSLVNSTTGITTISDYVGTDEVFTITATPITTQGYEATQYKWIFPVGVTVDSEDVILNEINALNGLTRTVVSTNEVLFLDFKNVASGITSLPISVYAVNGSGTSAIARVLVLKSAKPLTPGSISGSLTFSTACSNAVGYSVENVAGVTYEWTIPNGASIEGQGASSVIVDFTNVVAATSYKISVIAKNGTGISALRTLVLTKGDCAIAKELITPTAKPIVVFAATAYPNPSSSVFEVTTNTQSPFDLSVYDMLGRLIEQRHAQDNTMEIGASYPSGTYTILVSQAENLKTLRVIKR